MRTLSLQLGVVLCLGLSAACSKSGGSPAAPTPVPAALTIAGITVTPERTPTGYSYSVRFTVRETTGKTGVTLGTTTLVFSADTPIGQVDFLSAFSSTSLASGASQDSKMLTTTDDNVGHPACTKVEVRVTFYRHYRRNRSGNANGRHQQDSDAASHFELHSRQHRDQPKHVDHFTVGRYWSVKCDTDAERRRGPTSRDSARIARHQPDLYPRRRECRRPRHEAGVHQRVMAGR